jgi:hypothetical protein
LEQQLIFPRVTDAGRDAVVGGLGGEALGRHRGDHHGTDGRTAATAGTGVGYGGTGAAGYDGTTGAGYDNTGGAGYGGATGPAGATGAGYGNTAAGVGAAGVGAGAGTGAGMSSATGKGPSKAHGKMTEVMGKAEVAAADVLRSTNMQ